MRSALSRNEVIVLLTVLALLVLAWLGPVLAEPAHYHEFADQRAIAGLPFVMDVLSNIPFAMFGLAGGWYLASTASVQGPSVGERAMAALFFVGLVLTAMGSSWYHWQPDEARLAIDRGGMAVAFAGLLGLAASRVSDRMAIPLGLASLVLGLLAAQIGARTGNVLPWAVVQFGGGALIVGFALMRSRGMLHVRFVLIIAAYAAAKWFEMLDHEVYRWTAHVVSGHTLKHLLAALAAWPVVAAIRGCGISGQNAAATTELKGRVASPFRSV